MVERREKPESVGLDVEVSRQFGVAVEMGVEGRGLRELVRCCREARLWGRAGHKTDASSEGLRPGFQRVIWNDKVD